MRNEKRRISRYSIPKMEIRFSCNGAEISGRLVNICKEGLSFQFSPSSGDNMECGQVYITETGPTRFHLPVLTCRTVYDISVLAENQAFSGCETRLRGLQFIRLTKEQKKDLTFFLNQYNAESGDTS